VPEGYYARLDARVPGHGQDVARLKALQILLDGAPDQGLLMQIFT
jgi:4-hydroxyphenylpyruvate dioxygenase